MSEQPRDAERTRTAILNAARHLFAERGIKSVSIRNIAAAAGVSHGLIQQYFGTRENMVAGIIKHEIDTFMSAHSQVSSEAAWSGAEQLRNDLKAGLERFRDFALIIMRAELAGIEPEKMIDRLLPHPPCSWHRSSPTPRASVGRMSERRWIRSSSAPSSMRRCSVLRQWPLG